MLLFLEYLFYVTHYLFCVGFVNEFSDSNEYATKFQLNYQIELYNETQSMLSLRHISVENFGTPIQL